MNAGSSPILEKEVRQFYLHKFGQEYLDYLLGPNVALLTPEFIATSIKEDKKTLIKKDK